MHTATDVYLCIVSTGVSVGVRSFAQCGHSTAPELTAGSLHLDQDGVEEWK